MGYKLKTKRGAAKRFRMTGSGKIKARHAKSRHILEHKKPAEKHRHGGMFVLRGADEKLMKRALPYGLPK